MAIGFNCDRESSYEANSIKSCCPRGINMKFYLKLFTINLKSQMQYKISFWLTSLGQFVTAFTSFFSIQFIFMQVNAIDQFTYGQVLLCFSVIMMAFSVGEALGGGLATFSYIVNSGNFDRMLIRPRNVIMQIIIPNIDLTRIGLLIQGTIVICIAIPLSGIAWNISKIILLIAMVICGAVLFFCLFLIKATASFFTIESLDFLNIFTYGTRQFGRYPFSVYGSKILWILTFCIPLALIQYYPLLYLTNRSSSLWYFCAPFLSLIFICPCYLFFKMGLHRYKSAGS